MPLPIHQRYKKVVPTTIFIASRSSLIAYAFLAFAFLSYTPHAHAASFTTNFDSFSNGANFYSQVSPNWTQGGGTATDIKISNTQSDSSPNSIAFPSLVNTRLAIKDMGAASTTQITFALYMPTINATTCSTNTNLYNVILNITQYTNANATQITFCQNGKVWVSGNSISNFSTLSALVTGWNSVQIDSTTTGTSTTSYTITINGTQVTNVTATVAVTSFRYFSMGGSFSLGLSGNTAYIDNLSIYTGGDIPQPQLLPTQPITITSPLPYATTTSPTSFTFTYQIGQDSTWNMGEDAGTIPVGYQINLKNLATQETKTLYGSLGHTSYGSWTQTTGTTTLSDGTWSASVQLNNWTSTINQAQLGQILARFTVPVTYFGVNYNDTLDSTITYTPLANTWSASDCSINFVGTFDLPNCIKYITIPSTGSTSPLYQLQNISLTNTFPFVYMYQIPSLRNALFNSTTTASTTIGVSIPWFGGTQKQINFLNKDILASVGIAPLVKQILGWLLWLMVMEIAYYKIIRAHDTHTPT